MYNSHRQPEISIWPPKPKIVTSVELWQIASKFQLQIRILDDDELDKRLSKLLRQYYLVPSRHSLSPKYTILNGHFTLNFHYHEQGFQHLGYILIVEVFIEYFCCMTSPAKMCGSGPRSAEYCRSAKGLYRLSNDSKIHGLEWPWVTIYVKFDYYEQPSENLFLHT